MWGNDYIERELKCDDVKLITLATAYTKWRIVTISKRREQKKIKCPFYCIAVWLMKLTEYDEV